MIPKIIHYCWLGRDPYPEKIQKCIDSWNILLPDYDFKKWDETSFDINSVRWVNEAYEAKKYAFAADYIRFYALCNYGGIYLDTDVEVFKLFNPLLQSKSFIGFEYMSIPESAVIGAEIGVSWIKKCLGYYANKSFYDNEGNIKDLAVPIMMKATLRKYYNQKIYDTSKIQHFDDLDLYPYQYFSARNPYKNTTSINDDTFCLHHSVGSWCGGNRSTVNRYKHLLLRSLLGKQNYDEILYQHHLKKIINEVDL